MRWLLAVVVASGCGFTVSGAGPTGDDQPSPPGDDDPAPDAPAVTKQGCSTDPTLRMCLDFDNPSLTTDGSGLAHAITAANITVMPRATEQAASLDATSRLHVAETADLDIATNLTTSMWMQINGIDLPPTSATGRWLLDNNGQYFMAVRDQGKVRCGGGVITLDSPPQLVGVDNAWHHVACTFDGAVWSIFLDGDRVACRASTRPLDTDGNAGVALGANLGGSGTISETFTGGLDNIEVFARAKAPAEICAAAGRNGCSAECPSAE